jgi:hypothetical protein
MEAGVFIVAFSAIFGLVAKNSHSMSAIEETNHVFFILAIISGMTYYSSRWFSDLQNTSKGFITMQLPATSFEKIIVPIVLTGPLFGLLFWGLFQLMTNGNIIFWSSVLDKDFHTYWYNPKDFNIQLMTFFGIHSFFTLGGVFFKKYQFVKTGVSLGVITTALILLTGLLHGILLSGANITNEPTAWQILNLDNISTAHYFIAYGFSILTYITAWLTLKEKEV